MKLSEKIKKLEFLDRFSLFEVPNFLEEVIYNDLN
jgi:hypothetical protein